MASRYRPNVCAVLTDQARQRVLVFRRVDMRAAPFCWQFPQGGLDPGESARAALLRELEEEIGTNDIDLLAEAPEAIRYDYPAEVRARLDAAHPEKGGYLGQEQHWFLASLRSGTEAIRFDHQPPEFDAFRWVTPAEALRLVVPFKQQAYRRGLEALGLLGPTGQDSVAPAAPPG